VKFRMEIHTHGCAECLIIDCKAMEKHRGVVKL